ncbi:MAG: hypothetical protein ACOZB3_11795 [Calditrichota bacterium]
MANTTLNYLFARAPLSTVGFSGTVTSVSVYLNAPGGIAGDGVPMPRAGYLTGLQVWDGTRQYSDQAKIAFNAGDRLAIYCQNVGGSYTVRARLNGVSTALDCAEIPFNVTLFATLEISLLRT